VRASTIPEGLRQLIRLTYTTADLAMAGGIRPVEAVSVQDEIRWINHAGYELRSNGVRIVHDPWLDGGAFLDAWNLLSKSEYRFEDFAGVDYIWISHEHPDHFAPGVLRRIAADIRPSITILHQFTRDKRVIGYCRKLGFAVQELPDRHRVELKNGLGITCGIDAQDSWCYIETPNATYFNANDCVTADWAAIAAALPRPVDVLLTQFSYASWVANPGDDARMRQQAQEKIGQMEQQLQALRPRILIPFASYVWFCRPENFHLNAGANRIEDIHRRFKDRLPTVIMYPDDRYRPGESFDSERAVARYASDVNEHATPLPPEDKSTAMEELLRLSATHQQQLGQKNAMWLLKPLAWAGYVRPVRLYLHDIDQGIEYSMFGGVLHQGLPRAQCELEMRSSSFANMLINGYGFNTFYIGGRFRELQPGGCPRLSKHFAIFGQNATGYTFPGLLLRKDYLLAHLPALLTRRLRTGS
jgi:hypothetical protein